MLYFDDVRQVLVLRANGRGKSKCSENDKKISNNPVERKHFYIMKQ